ncbi:hypothetical protein RFI_03981 [Reticulomyxa filosa]|uniref:Uncharacterized protein n=1 Tax=Reticulomyxa filosa TaxID=46433 RepID=X6P4I5_RETFI|nr:hypothetical protein RFI_03981 [Reticulomyxa filosa]|eukprot:ETO33126.1 hypothetical protein RFI_03981 [Reticulomyxa filosa]
MSELMLSNALLKMNPTIAVIKAPTIAPQPSANPVCFICSFIFSCPQKLKKKKKKIKEIKVRISNQIIVNPGIKSFMTEQMPSSFGRLNKGYFQLNKQNTHFPFFLGKKKKKNTEKEINKFHK